MKKLPLIAGIVSLALIAAPVLAHHDRYQPLIMPRGRTTASSSMMRKIFRPTVRTPRRSSSPSKSKNSRSSMSSAASLAASSLPGPLQAIVIYANDLSFTPRMIRVHKGTKVQVLFIIDRKDTYYGGLDIRSDKFRTGTVAPGQRATVEFVADESFSFKSFWPSTSALKATGRVEVLGK